MGKYAITKDGVHYQELENKLKKYNKILKDLGPDLPHGETDSSRDYLRQMAESLSLEIKKIEDIIYDCTAIEVKERDTEKVLYGSIVEYKDLSDPEGRVDIVEIVGHLEGDHRAGKISYDVPLGKAMMGKGVGDIVSFEFPKGERSIQICGLYSEWPKSKKSPEY
jgi:transcription elongation GreA/GreB family factor